MEEGREEESYLERQLHRRLIIQLERLSRDMEKFNIAEYVNLLNNPRRYLFVNFLSGIARGLGIALGATLLAGLFIYVLQRLVVLNLPLIGNFIAELIRIVNQRL